MNDTPPEDFKNMEDILQKDTLPGIWQRTVKTRYDWR